MYLSLTFITWKTKENLRNENCGNKEVIIDENVYVYHLIYLIMFILINIEAFKVKETML